MSPIREMHTGRLTCECGAKFSLTSNEVITKDTMIKEAKDASWKMVDDSLSCPECVAKHAQQEEKYDCFSCKVIEPLKVKARKYLKKIIDKADEFNENLKIEAAHNAIVSHIIAELPNNQEAVAMVILGACSELRMQHMFEEFKGDSKTKESLDSRLKGALKKLKDLTDKM